MWSDLTKLDKYQYVRTNPYIIRTIAFLGVLATIYMGYGFWNYIHLRPLYLFVFGPIVLVLTLNKLMRFIIQLFYPKFDIKKHEAFIKNFWAQNPEPSVDIFLPYAGEEIEVHEAVVKAAVAMNYKNYKVYMLDDAGKEEHAALAEKYGCIRLSRPNKGEYKKSGNLEYGYAHSEGQFIFILDADFIPEKDALKDLIPYIVQDPEIGILQTPQYFEQSEDVHSRSKIEFGGGNIVEDFYRIILPCRDEFKAAMCVGTSAIYRRTAIECLHGTPKVHASEDLATGLLITQHGFYVKYLPLIVSIGTSPDTFQGYFKQHLRWCSGNLIFAKYWPNARLNLMARLIYLINPMYYISEALTVVFSFQFLVLLYFHSDSLSIYQTVYFLPYIFVTKVLIPLTKVNKSKIGTKLAALNNSYTYFYTYIQLITKNVPAWHPTGLKFNGVHPDFMSAMNIGTTISSVYITLFTFVLISRPHVFGNYNTYAVLAWSFYSVFWHAMYLYMVASYIHPLKLPSIKSDAGRLLLYARTNIPVVLFSILLLTAIYNSLVTMSNPNTPTALAIASLNTSPLHEISFKTATIKDVPLINGPRSQILAASVSAQPAQITISPPKATPQSHYVYVVKGGDTLLEIAKDATQKYAQESGINLSDKEVSKVSYDIITDDKNKKIRPGQEIKIETDDIADSIAVIRPDQTAESSQQATTDNPSPTSAPDDPTRATATDNNSDISPSTTSSVE